MTSAPLNTPTSSDRENLSALFDGELSGDAARFVAKRLGHDAEWQRACGRWQLIGDAMRGQADLAAPNDLATRVSAALASASTVQSATPEPKPASRLRRWMGGALAASVAVAALLVARPLWQSPATSSAPVADSSRAAPAVPRPQPAVPAQTTPSEEAGKALATAAVAVASLPPRAHVTRRSSARPRAARRDAEPVTAIAAAQVAHQPMLHTVPADPFTAPQPDIVTRPWPRAVLPALTTNGPLTASFGSASETPSFYPFEPRQPAQRDAAPTQDVQQP